MISTESIKEILSKILEPTEFFLVETLVKPGNRIVVYVDKLEGISIDECAEISRLVESHLNRDEEDYELEISSPGLTQPFKVKQQYFKNIGKDIEVLLVAGDKITGKLISMNDKGIVMEAIIKVKIPGKKKAESGIENKIIEFTDIKSTKVSINF